MTNTRMRSEMVRVIPLKSSNNQKGALLPFFCCYGFYIALCCDIIIFIFKGV